MVTRIVSICCFLLVFASVTPAFAQQSAVKPNEEAVRLGLADLVEFEGTNFRSQAYSSLLTGAVFAGLGGYLLYSGLDSDSPGETVLGATSITLGIGQMILGLIDVLDTSAIEHVVPTILNSENPGVAGYAVLSLSAEQAHKKRIRSGVSSLVTAVGTGLILIPVIQDESEEGYGGISDTSWYIILGSLGALSLYGGIVALIKPSVPEEIFENVKRASGIADSSFEFEVTPIAVKGQDAWMPGLGAVGRF